MYISSGNEPKYNVDQRKEKKKMERNQNAKIQDESFRVVGILGLIRSNESNGKRNGHSRAVIRMWRKNTESQLTFPYILQV